MNFYTKELAAMFSSTRIIVNPKFIGKALVSSLDSNLIVKVEFTGVGVSPGNYNALKVTIIHRANGEVDSQCLRFVDVIGKKRANQSSPYLFEPTINETAGTSQWHTPLSADNKAMIARAVLDYISVFTASGSRVLPEL